MPHSLEHLAGVLARRAPVALDTSGTVRLNRGAGAGCVVPATSTNVPRSTLCGCSAASPIVSTGAKHTSVASMISHHSARVLLANTSVRRAFSARPLGLVHLLGELARRPRDR